MKKATAELIGTIILVLVAATMGYIFSELGHEEPAEMEGPFVVNDTIIVHTPAWVSFLNESEVEVSICYEGQDHTHRIMGDYTFSQHGGFTMPAAYAVSIVLKEVACPAMADTVSIDQIKKTLYIIDRRK